LPLELKSKTNANSSYFLGGNCARCKIKKTPEKFTNAP